MRASALKERTRQFTVRVIELTQTLPDTRQAVAVLKPMLRCGTAVGANYRALCRARDSYDFMTRLIACEEAVDQSCYWFEVLRDAKLIDANSIEPLLGEGQAIKKILARSRKIAIKRYQKEAGGLSEADDSAAGNGNQDESSSS